MRTVVDLSAAAVYISSADWLRQNLNPRRLADRHALGNKGAGLAEMILLGLPVPPGFVITTNVEDTPFHHHSLDAAIVMAMSRLDRARRIAGIGEPFTVSVRSSPCVSMPGMMDTVFDVAPGLGIKRAVNSVFASWDNPRAEAYRNINNISNDVGVAVVVQTMVHGDRDSRSGSGVVFTREPNTGEKILFGEYLAEHTGEDLVSGEVTPSPLGLGLAPALIEELARYADELEKHFKDAQEIEFTVESGKLWLLQTRTAVRSARAAVRMAMDMVAEGFITPDVARARVTPVHRAELDLPVVIGNPTPITTGSPASPGAATGRVVTTSAEAVRLAALGVDVILVRPETSPEDIAGIHAAKGVLTAIGGVTSHAAVTARGMGRPCVVGVADLVIDPYARIHGRVLELITIDGHTGRVYVGPVPTTIPARTPEIQAFLATTSE